MRSQNVPQPSATSAQPSPAAWPAGRALQRLRQWCRMVKWHKMPGDAPVESLSIEGEAIETTRSRGCPTPAEDMRVGATQNRPEAMGSSTGTPATRHRHATRPGQRLRQKFYVIPPNVRFAYVHSSAVQNVNGRRYRAEKSKRQSGRVPDVRWRRAAERRPDGEESHPPKNVTASRSAALFTANMPASYRSSAGKSRACVRRLKTTQTAGSEARRATTRCAARSAATLRRHGRRCAGVSGRHKVIGSCPSPARERVRGEAQKRAHCYSRTRPVFWQASAMS